ncbi:ABC transporter permease [Pseudonocardia benzenivorans]|uniref:Transport permease protein n=1 Tax=Pseudonocardia benzenivorans TaxID=228005 RepID=A0ABW3VDI4_9PSEU
MTTADALVSAEAAAGTTPVAHRTDVRPPLPPSDIERGRRGPSTIRHGLTLAWRGVIKTIHSPEALIDVTLQPVIFLLLFVYVFGGAIAGNTTEYLQFALPGVLVQTVVFASAGTGVGLAEDLHTGIFDRFRSLPISRSAPLVGAIMADLVRYLTSGVIMLVLGVILGFRMHTGPLAVLAAMGLVMVFAFALCWVFTALAMLVRQPRSVQGIGAMIMLPLTFGSNVFVPSSSMPGWLQAFVDVNPVSKVADAVRGLLTGGPVAGPATTSLIAAAVIVAVFAPIAVTLYRKRA